MEDSVTIVRNIIGLRLDRELVEDKDYLVARFTTEHNYCLHSDDCPAQNCIMRSIRTGMAALLLLSPEITRAAYLSTWCYPRQVWGEGSFYEQKIEENVVSYHGYEIYALAIYGNDENPLRLYDIDRRALTHMNISYPGSVDRDSILLGRL